MESIKHNAVSFKQHSFIAQLFATVQGVCYIDSLLFLCACLSYKLTEEKSKKKKHYNYKYKKKKQGGVESILPPKGCFAAQQSASRLISEVILITVAVAVQ